MFFQVSLQPSFPVFPICYTFQHSLTIHPHDKHQPLQHLSFYKSYSICSILKFFRVHSQFLFSNLHILFSMDRISSSKCLFPICLILTNFKQYNCFYGACHKWTNLLLILFEFYILLRIFCARSFLISKIYVVFLLYPRCNY